MQVKDFLSLGVARKQIIGSGLALTYTSRKTDGALIYVLNDCTTVALTLKYDISGSTDYGGIILPAGTFLPGVSSIEISDGYVLIIDK